MWKAPFVMIKKKGIFRVSRASWETKKKEKFWIPDKIIPWPFRMPVGRSNQWATERLAAKEVIFVINSQEFIVYWQYNFSNLEKCKSRNMLKMKLFISGSRRRSQCGVLSKERGQIRAKATERRRRYVKKTMFWVPKSSLLACSFSWRIGSLK